MAWLGNIARIAVLVVVATALQIAMAVRPEIVQQDPRSVEAAVTAQPPGRLSWGRRRALQGSTSADSCRYADDGECDEPTYCAAGTDSTDCSSAAASGCPAHAHMASGERAMRMLAQPMIQPPR